MKSGFFNRFPRGLVALLALAFCTAATARAPALSSDAARTLEPCQNRGTALWGLCRADGSAAPPVVPQTFAFIGRGGPLFPARAAASAPLGYIDGSGQWRIAAQFQTAAPFTEGLAVVGDGARSAAIDDAGKPVIPWFTGLLYPPSQGLLCFVPGGAIEPTWFGRLRRSMFGGPGDDPYPAAWWNITGQAGFMDTAGKTVIAPRFEPKLNFLVGGCGFGSTGYAAMRQDGKEGLIDRTGRWVVPPEYEYLGIVFSGNRKVVAMIADRLLHAGVFLDTVERFDGFMGPDGDVRWRETGPPRESPVAGGLGRAFVNWMLFPRWQQELTNEEVSVRMLVAWVGCVALASWVAWRVWARGPRSAPRVGGALAAATFTLPLVFLAGLLSIVTVPALALLAVGLYALPRLRRR